jgi:hypothetical protein
MTLEDTGPKLPWGNIHNKKFGQKALETQRRHRMTELNAKNGELIVRVGELSARIMELEDGIVAFKEANEELKDTIKVLEGKLIEKARSKKVKQSDNP